MPVLRTPPGGSNTGFTRSAVPQAASSGRSQVIPQLEDIPPPGGGGGGSGPDLTLDWSTGSLPSEVTHGGGDNGTRWNSSGLLEAASAGRITYDPNTLACRGLWLEEERTNYANRSTVLTDDDRWWTSAVTITGGDTETGYLLAGGDYDISHHIYNNSATTGATGPVFSVFLKASTASRAFLSVSNGWGTFGGALFDISSTPATGVAQNGGVSGTVDDRGTSALPDGWSRPWIACTLSDGNGKPQVGMADNSTTWNENSGYGDCKSSPFIDMYAKLPQIEVGLFPSSPIFNPTWSGVTRSPDTATITNEIYCGAASYKFRGRTAIGSPAPGARQILASGGTASDGWTVYRNSSNEVRLEVVVSSSVVADVLGGTVANYTDVLIGIRLAANDCNIAVNGVAGTPDTSSSAPTITAARLGYDAAGANYWMGTLEAAYAYTTALNDDDLAVAPGDEAGTGSGYTIEADAGSYAVTGTAANLLVGRRVDATAGSYSTTGTAAGLLAGRVVGASAGSYAITGATAGLLATRLLDAGGSSYTITGTAATLGRQISLAADAGTFGLSGTAVGLTVGRVLSATAGSYAIAGTDATLIGAANKTISADAGSFVVTGTDATLRLGRVVSAASGSFGITGTAAGLAAARLVAASPGSFTIAGTDVGLRRTAVMAAASETYAITGTTAGLLRGLQVAADGGSLEIAGTSADLLFNRYLSAEGGAFDVVGTDATLVFFSENLVTPVSRTVFVDADNRVVAVASEIRVTLVIAEPRRVVVANEGRSVSVGGTA